MAQPRPGLGVRRKSVHGFPGGAQSSTIDRFMQGHDAELQSPGGQNGTSLEPLPPIASFANAEAEAREGHILKKLEQCEVICNFDSMFSDMKNKQIKEAALEEIAKAVTEAEWVTRPVFEAFMRMVSRNLERDWAPPENPDAPEFDLEEDPPVQNREWKHQKLVYSAFVAMLESPTVKLEYAKEYVNKGLIVQLLGIFNTPDLRERQEVKTALHRLYSKFVCHRSYIRSAISSVYECFMYDRSSSRSIGIAELLEITGSIINGFSMPIKEEHIRFLKKVLVPLHSPDGIQLYHPQLAYCVLQYINHDPTLVHPVVRGLVRYWPRCNSNKEVKFLDELEELVDTMQGDDLLKLQDVIFGKVAQCTNSVHFQVSERSLYFLNNPKVQHHIQGNADAIIPMLVPVLHHQHESHWNENIKMLADQMLTKLLEISNTASTRVLGDLKRKRVQGAQDEQDRRAKWQRITSMASRNSPMLARKVLLNGGLGAAGIVARSPLPTRRASGDNSADLDPGQGPGPQPMAAEPAAATASAATAMAVAVTDDDDNDGEELVDASDVAAGQLFAGAGPDAAAVAAAAAAATAAGQHQLIAAVDGLEPMPVDLSESTEVPMAL